MKGLRTIRPLPSPVERAVVPQSFSPSRLDDLDACPASVFLTSKENSPPPSGMLGVSPLARFGSVLHHAKHEFVSGRWGEAEDAENAIRSIFDAVVRMADEDAVDDPALEGCVPLSAVVPRAKWLERRRNLFDWAKMRPRITSTGEPPEKLLGPSTKGTEIDTKSSWSLETGSEIYVFDRKLRLAGRVDSMQVDEGGKVTISDYKTGRMIWGDDRSNPLHELQLFAYAMIVEEHEGVREVSLKLEGAEDIEVPWTTATRKQMKTKLDGLHEAYPAGAIMEIGNIARPGTHCSFCRFRPSCGPYRTHVVEWWSNRQGSPRSLPRDTWGELISIEQHGNQFTLRLRDDAGRRVHIERLSQDWGWKEIGQGKRLWFFDLEPEEATRHHGREIHPRNFRELKRRPCERDANGLRIFVEG